VSSLLWLTALVAVYLATVVAFRPAGTPFSAPQVWDAVILLAAAVLDLVYRWRRATISRKVFWITAGASMIVALPWIILDSSLPTLAIKLETLWATAMLALVAGMGLSLLYAWLVLNARSRIAVVISLLMLLAAGGMRVRTAKWFRPFPTDRFEWRSKSPPIWVVRAEFTRGIGNWFPTGGQFLYGMPSHDPKPNLKYMRSGGFVYWLGARLRLAGVGVAYNHSSRFEVDYFVGPFFAVLVPYWFAVAIGGLGVFVGVPLFLRQPYRDAARAGQAEFLRQIIVAARHAWRRKR
jgi:hypothetical protein